MHKLNSSDSIILKLGLRFLAGEFNLCPLELATLPSFLILQQILASEFR
jgi:hypothetical protein